MQKAIESLNGNFLSDGRRICVKLPENRGRSSSQSSFHSQEHRNYSGLYHRDQHIRQPSMPQTHFASPATSSNSPLTEGFQAQLSPPAIVGMQLIVAHLNQKHEAVTGIPQGTPERLSADASHITESLTPSKTKGKAKKGKSIRGSNGTTPSATPSKSRSQTNVHANALEDITNKNMLSSQSLETKDPVNNPSFTPLIYQKGDSSSQDVSSKEDTQDVIATTFQTRRKDALTPEKLKPKAKKYNLFSLDTLSASQAPVMICQQRNLVNVSKEAVENAGIAMTEDMTTSPVVSKSPFFDENATHAIGEPHNNASLHVNSLLNFEVIDTTQNDIRESADAQKSLRSTKKNKKKNKIQRRPIPEFAGQSSLPVETSPLGDQAFSGTLIAVCSADAPISNYPSAIDTSIGDSSFSKKANGSKNNSSPRTVTPIPSKSDSDTTLCNSPIMDSLGSFVVSKIENCVSTTNSIPKQKYNNKHKSRKSSHVKNDSNESANSSGSLRKADRDISKSENGSENDSKSTPVATYDAIDRVIKSDADPVYAFAKNSLTKDVKCIEDGRIGGQRQDCFISIAGDEYRPDVESPQIVPIVDNAKSQTDHQEQARHFVAASENHNDTQWPALGNSKILSPANINQKPVASSAVRTVNERIGVVVPAIPLNMERRRQL